MGELDMQKIVRSGRRQLFIQVAGTLIVLGAVYSITTLLWLFWPWTLWITGGISAFYTVATVVACIAYRNVYVCLQEMLPPAPAPKKSTALPVPGTRTMQ